MSVFRHAHRTAILSVHYYVSGKRRCTKYECRKGARRVQSARKKGLACVVVYNVLQITSRECVARVYLFYTKIVFIIYTHGLRRASWRKTGALVTLTMESVPTMGCVHNARSSPLWTFSICNGTPRPHNATRLPLCARDVLSWFGLN